MWRISAPKLLSFVYILVWGNEFYILLVPLYSSGSFIFFWFLYILLVPLYSSGSFIFFWFLYILLVPLYSSGSFIFFWFLYILLVPLYSSGSFIFFWFLYILLVPLYSSGSFIFFWFTTGVQLTYSNWRLLLVHRISCIGLSRNSLGRCGGFLSICLFCRVSVLP